ncbi:MAG: hypothetical protein ACO23V_00720 [Chitinophagaceae bacterium]
MLIFLALTAYLALDQYLCTMLRYVFYGLLIYMLYRLIFNFILPVALATRKVRKQFKQAKERMEEMQQQQYQQQQTTFSQSQKTQAKPAADDYIDFEEVK